MERFEHLLAAVAPGLLVLTYGVSKTRSSWGSEALWTAFLLGSLGVAAALPFELTRRWLVSFASFKPLADAAVVAVFIAAIPEETIKYLIVIGAAEPHVDARRRQDTIALAIAVSLGFATVENFLFVVAPANWQLIAALRALTAVPGHGIFGLTMGALLTAGRVRPAGRAAWMALALVIPILMHAAYDFPLFALRSVGAESAIGLWLVALWIVVQLSASIAAIALCNWILPVAAKADRISGRDLRGSVPNAIVVSLGGAFLLVAAAAAIAMLLNRSDTYRPIGVGLAIFPLAFAVDLIWTGLRRHGKSYGSGGHEFERRR